MIEDPEGDLGRDGPERLFEQVLGREDDERTWSALKGRAALDPGLWSRLALELELDARIRGVAGLDEGSVRTMRPESVARPETRLRLVALSGWLVAALLLLSSMPLDWFGVSDRPVIGDPRREPLRTEQVATDPGVRAEVVTDSDRSVVKELPSIFLASRQRSDGRIEVLTVHRRVESEIVEEWTAWRRDESGEVFPTVVPAEQLVRVARDV